MMSCRVLVVTKLWLKKSFTPNDSRRSDQEGAVRQISWDIYPRSHNGLKFLIKLLFFVYYIVIIQILIIIIWLQALLLLSWYFFETIIYVILFFSIIIIIDVNHYTEWPLKHLQLIVVVEYAPYLSLP